MTRKAENIKKMVISSKPENIHIVEQETEKIARKIGFCEDDLDSLAISVTEVVANAIMHGNGKDASKKVYIEFIYSKKQIEIHVRDEGIGFNPEGIANPLEPENLFKESGRGIFIVKTLMDDVSYKFHSSGTEIILLKTCKDTFKK
ncbi:ATP-binding protein [candidate division KSB1 bacterium]|nr:ATP-binding protein [candidate division KSB1 bacterium]